MLYDEVLTLPGCTKSRPNSCKDLDQTDGSEVRKQVKIERFVPGSGYLTVFFQDRSSQTGGFNGGFTLDQVYYEPNSGGRLDLGGGMQVFERGNIVLEFDQPYSFEERFQTEYEFVISYLAHTELERRSFLIRLQDDPQEFFQFKEREKRNFDPLCLALRAQTRFPSVCPDDFSLSDDPLSFDPSSSTFVTDPNALPELDFSGKPTRAPLVTLRERQRQVFINEPVTLELKEVFDPDGKCQFFQFIWEKPTRMQVKEVSIDSRLGDLFFVPLNSGTFTVRLRAKEVCKELGTLSSDAVLSRVIVNDKAIAFSDLSEAPQYQNAIYELYHLGVVQGYPDGTMRPNAPINRAEFLKVIFETLDYRISQTAFSPRYADVLPGVWYDAYIHLADELGVIKGYPDGRFHPEWTVNLVEALKMAMNFTTIDIQDDVVYSFKDVANTDWFSRYVKTAFREGILDDIEPGGYVRPAQLLTRGKAMQIVVRTLLFPVNRINYTNRDVLRRPDEFEDFSSFIY